MKNLSIEKMTSLVLLLFAIGFNLWLYRAEPSATTDPNDNTFQYALIDRTNQIWDFASKNCSRNSSFVICNLSFIIDHWVPNWAQGYNLPTYYSHLPQITIVASWRFLNLFIRSFHYSFIDLFAYYHIIIYLLLCFFPLSLFIALRVIGLPSLTAGMGALLASHLSTDGLYGLDPSSFLWRGYGLSSQLFAMTWLPMAVAFSWRFFNYELRMKNYESFSPLSVIRHSSFLLSLLFLFLTAEAHLGIGIMAFLSLIPLGLAQPFIMAMRQQSIREIVLALKNQLMRLLMLLIPSFVLLSYWVIPIVLGDNYHNFSFWDPVWKFNSYGARDILTKLFNGDLFDFGRLPILTGLTLVGLFVLLSNQVTGLAGLASLFLFWLLLYFGRTTWGGLIDLIPGMREFHLSRFIVGVHIAGLFLIPIGLDSIFRTMNHLTTRHVFIRSFVYLLICLFVYLFTVPQTIRYAAYNDTLIKQANRNAEKIQSETSLLFSTLNDLQKSHPGRVFAGRGGAWGRDFRIAETPYYMYLSAFGIPTILWLPETWSPNADTEQYFREENLSDYDLYNVRYIVAPPNQTAHSFWKLIKETKSWKLYEVDTTGYITTGIRSTVVSTDKRSFINLVRLWIQSDYPKKGLYPELTFDTTYPKHEGFPNFKMLDEVTYRVPDGSVHNLFTELPSYVGNLSHLSNVQIISQKQETDMIFKATVETKTDCPDCLLILKQTYSPNWKATVDGKKITPLTIFPFYTAIPLSQPGTHDIIFSYQPGTLKIVLLVGEIIAATFFLMKTLFKHLQVSR